MGEEGGDGEASSSGISAPSSLGCGYGTPCRVHRSCGGSKRSTWRVCGPNSPRRAYCTASGTAGASAGFESSGEPVVKRWAMSPCTGRCRQALWKNSSTSSCCAARGTLGGTYAGPSMNEHTYVRYRSSLARSAPVGRNAAKARCAVARSSACTTRRVPPGKYEDRAGGGPGCCASPSMARRSSAPSGPAGSFGSSAVHTRRGSGVQSGGTSTCGHAMADAGPDRGGARAKPGGKGRPSDQVARPSCDGADVGAVAGGGTSPSTVGGASP